MVTPVVAVRFGNQDGIVLRWKIRSGGIAIKWLSSLRKALPFGINERNRIYNMPGQGWNRSTICMEMTSCMKRIEEFHQGVFETWPHPTMDHEATNSMHLAFERLRGSIDQPSQMYLDSPLHVQMEICRYNVLIHRWESFVMKGPPRVVCTFQQPFREWMDDEDFESFSLSHGYGAMLINYPQVGKQLLDVFRDDDSIVSPEAIRPMDRYAAGFVLRFAEINDATAMDLQGSFDSWFLSNQDHLGSLGFRREDPRLAVGYIQVGDLIEDRERNSVLGEIGRAGRIDDVWIEE